MSVLVLEEVFSLVHSVSDSPANDKAVLRVTYLIAERWEEAADMAAGNQPEREGTLDGALYQLLGQ